MRYTIRCLTPLAAATLLAACGAGGDASDGTQGTGIMDGKADRGSEGAEALPALAGHYVLRMESTVEARNRNSGEVTLATTVVTALVGVLGTEDPALHDLEFGLCDVTLPELAGQTPEVDADTLRKAPVAHARAALQATPATDTEPAGVTLVTERTAVVLGVDPEDALTDALPEDKNDPRVVDLEDDGKPGMTIKVSGFSIYTGVRARFGLSGGVADDGVISGDAGLAIDLAVFGDNIPFVNVANKIAAAQEANEVLSEAHKFTLVPLEPATDGGPALDCTQLHRTTTLSPAPADTSAIDEIDETDTIDEADEIDETDETDETDEPASGRDARADRPPSR